MHSRLLTLLAVTCLLFTSCKKESNPAPIPKAGRRVFVICEGLYGNGSSALTLYQPDSGTVIADAFESVNKQTLGDVFVSMVKSQQGQYLLSINNSDQIIALEHTGLQHAGSMQVPKPRYIVQVSPVKAYVSTLFSNKIYIINPSTLSVSGIIEMPANNPEGMHLIGDKLYVACWDTAVSTIYTIDINSNAIGAPIPVAGAAPQELLQDREGMLWVLSGNRAKGKESKLSRINPTTGSIMASYAFGDAEPIKPVFNATKDTLYFIEVAYSGGSSNNGVYRMDIHAATAPSQVFIPATGLQYYWALGIDPRSGYIYVGDPKGFTQKGSVSVYRTDASLVTSFACGVGPGHFYFE